MVTRESKQLQWANACCVSGKTIKVRSQTRSSKIGTTSTNIPKNSKRRLIGAFFVSYSDVRNYCVPGNPNAFRAQFTTSIFTRTSRTTGARTNRTAVAPRVSFGLLTTNHKSGGYFF